MAEKTEQPTQKKLSDGAKKGQILKSRDAVVTTILLAGILYISFYFSFNAINEILKKIIDNKFEINLLMYVHDLLRETFKITFSFIGVISFVVCLISWFQSKFKIANEAVKFNLNAINPISGFKRIFSWRTVKELVKTLFYIVLLSISMYIFWLRYKKDIFSTIYDKVTDLFAVWSRLLFILIIFFLASLFIIIILDYLAEYFLFMKDMKMEKEEVKREYKEQEGSPEIKSKRRQLHQELLSEQLKSDIDNSKLIIANPTHIAIGIFFKPELSPIPLISVVETDMVALAVRKYAELKKIPVIRDINLARKLYNTHKRYDYVSLNEIDKVLDLLYWLDEVEKTNRPIYENVEDDVVS